jgi:hypothetical protein
LLWDKALTQTRDRAPDIILSYINDNVSSEHVVIGARIRCIATRRLDRSKGRDNCKARHTEIASKNYCEVQTMMKRYRHTRQAFIENGIGLEQSAKNERIMMQVNEQMDC